MPQQKKKKKTFFSFLEEDKILKGRERNRPTGACPQYYLFFIFLFSFLSFLFFLAFLLSFYSIFLSCSSPIFFTPILGIVEVFFWVTYHPSRTYLPKELGQEPQSRSLPLSPPQNHTPLPLTHDSTKFHISWVQAGGAWASRVLSLHVCPRSACCSCVCRNLEACLHSLLLFFILSRRLFHNSLPTLEAGLPLILGFTFLLAHFLIAIMFYHIILSFLL